MALFELDDGRLVQAQFGREVEGGLTPDVMAAVRSQVLEIIGRPLFPITWRDFSPGQAAARGPRLTALDASGQVVAVEVISTLDAEFLIDSLSRLADTASMSWTDLASEYPGDVQGFRADWGQFRASMPPSPPNGPRLILVAGSIHPDVRPALDVLSSSGVEVHEMSLRQMSNGRTFLEVMAVGPRMYGHRVNLLSADTGAVAAVDQAQMRRITSVVKQPTDPVPEAASASPENPALPANPPHLGHSDSPSHPTHSTPPPFQPESAPVKQAPPRRSFPSRLERRADTGSIILPKATLTHSARGLESLGAVIGRTTPIALSLDLGARLDGQLSATGRIRVPAGEFRDPTAALVASNIQGVDGWEAWRLGDSYGPTLAEAIDEINRDGVRHY